MKFSSDLLSCVATLENLAHQFELGQPLRGITPEQLLQGLLADAMTHAGQLALLRRLAGAPVAPENFLYAVVRADNLSPDQPPLVKPGNRRGEWPEDWAVEAAPSPQETLG